MKRGNCPRCVSEYIDYQGFNHLLEPTSRNCCQWSLGHNVNKKKNRQCKRSGKYFFVNWYLCLPHIKKAFIHGDVSAMVIAPE